MTLDGAQQGAGEHSALVETTPGTASARTKPGGRRRREGRTQLHAHRTVSRPNSLDFASVASNPCALGRTRETAGGVARDTKGPLRWGSPTPTKRRRSRSVRHARPAP